MKTIRTQHLTVTRYKNRAVKVEGIDGSRATYEDAVRFFLGHLTTKETDELLAALVSERNAASEQRGDGCRFFS